ncbi:hypothetical protein JW848_04405 [Candidatus Bipolaricaulota bacterium]|nr:hypothetical protein [Candidatus Bipolaricaulota bacterium]
MSYVRELRSGGSRRIGGKARQLQTLASLGARIPRTWVCDWRAHAAWMRGDRHVEQAVRDDLSRRLDPNREYAVRSSADIEDGSRRSFAGRFDSILRVQGVDRLITAVRTVWESAARGGDTVRMAVMVQEMVDAQVSGIAFSRNPITGAEEVMIEAVSGTGEVLTSGLASPERWMVAEGDAIESSAAVAVGADVLQDIAAMARRWEKAVGVPIDLEWAVDGAKLYWLQLRPISALQSPDVYSSRMSKEFLPGLIMPLVWSVNVPMVNRAWLNLLEEIIGRIDMEPERLARRIGCRAYFNMGRMGELFAQAGLRRDVLEAMMGFNAPSGPPQRAHWMTIGMLRHIPRLTGFAVRHLRFRRHFARWLPPTEQALQRREAAGFSAEKTQRALEEIDCLLAMMQDIAYYRIVSMLRHAAIHRFVTRGLARKRVPAEAVDIVASGAADEGVDPSKSLFKLRALFLSLPEDTRTRLRETGTGRASTDGNREGGAFRFLLELERFLERFGYLSDRGNDFSAETWRENPTLVVNMLASGETRARCADPNGASRETTKWSRRIRRLAAKETRARFDRDRVGALFSRGHAILRRAFLELGRRLQQEGMLQAPADIFFITYDEIRAVTRGELPASVVQGRITDRQDEMRLAGGADLPEVVYGEQVPEFRADRPTEEVLHGVAASRGFYEGKARVVRSVEEFDRVQPEDVLVISHSDIGWMPLLDKASAIVAESGGLLSHSAIVARERGIPAVVSVARAQTIPDGAWVIVDGSAGTISLSSKPSAAASSIEG